MEKKNKIRIVDDESLFKRLKRIFVNRNYKDSLFKRVFRDKKDLLELYNALNGTDYTNEADLEVVTMEDVIFLKVKNDLSFIIGNTLNLYGHQSTINPNVALRAFLYFAKHYEAIVAGSNDSLYGDDMIPLPFPQCVVFYNGDREIEEESTIKMSTAFEIPEGRDKEVLVPAVECTVRVLNINYGHNKDLAEKCKRLGEYSEFIQIVKDFYETEHDKDRAMMAAVDVGIERNLIKDILIQEKAGVKSMLLTEFDEKKYINSIRRSGYREGFAEAEEQMRLKYDAETAQYKTKIADQDTKIDELETQLAKLEAQLAELNK